MQNLKEQLLSKLNSEQELLSSLLDMRDICSDWLKSAIADSRTDIDRAVVFVARELIVDARLYISGQEDAGVDEGFVNVAEAALSSALNKAINGMDGDPPGYLVAVAKYADSRLEVDQQNPTSRN